MLFDVQRISIVNAKGIYKGKVTTHYFINNVDCGMLKANQLYLYPLGYANTKDVGFVKWKDGDSDYGTLEIEDRYLKRYEKEKSKGSTHERIKYQDYLEGDDLKLFNECMDVIRYNNDLISEANKIIANRVEMLKPLKEKALKEKEIRKKEECVKLASTMLSDEDLKRLFEERFGK